MSEKRILVPKGDIDWNIISRRNNIVEGEYEGIEEALTRPITRDDVREMIRMPDKWTENDFIEYAERAGRYLIFMPKEIDILLDIALRPAPVEKDPWDEMDRIIIQGGSDIELLTAWDRLKEEHRRER